MTSRQHQDWLNRGRPDSGLALPLAQLRDTLRAEGFTVYDWPDDSHLDAEPPEDHTFYSETGWPHPSPKWWRHAIDIMPRSTDAAGAAELYDLGNRLYVDRAAGRITWLKYVNVPALRGVDGLKQARQHRWEPNHQVFPSSDVGHIHISSVTGCENLSSPYNPLSPLTEETPDMDLTAVGQIISGTTNAQVFADLWAWAADAADPNTPPKGRSRFEFPPQLVAIQHKLDQQAADIASLKATLAQIAQAVGSGLPTGDVQVTGTLHIGATPPA